MRLHKQVLSPVLTLVGIVGLFCATKEASAQASADTALARRFAPVVYLHPDDQFRPASVEWYLRRVQMRFAVRGGGDAQILGKGQVTATALVSQSHNGQRSGSGYPSEFFLQIPNDDQEEETRRGSLANAPCYSHVTSTRRGKEIQYWFFYPYSGNIADVGNFAHEGDWEHITVRLAQGNTSISEVYYAAHEGGAWHPARRAVNRGRPVVYSALHSHASYPTVGEQPRRGILPNDVTAAGPGWDCANRLVHLDVPRPAWLRYSGRWGEIGNLDFTTGPRGPAFHGSWQGEGVSRSGVLVFNEGNGCTQDVVGRTTDAAGQQINLRRTHGWENDEARSLRLNGVVAGTVIEIYDNSEARRDDDYTIITVKRTTNGYCVRTFESSWEDADVRVEHRHDNGLDGKVSHIRVRR
jgi:hypothetical protein